MDLVEKLKTLDQQALIRDSFAKATPVARKVAMYRMKQEGKSFGDIEDEFIDIIGIESRLYDNMKKSLVEHVLRHGLDVKSLDLFDEFMNLPYFDKNMINSVLRKVRRAYVQDQNNRNLEYLIANQGQVLTREQIALKIWGYESDSEYNNVEVYMSFARKKLAFVGSKCEIKALRGIGYELRCRDVS